MDGAMERANRSIGQMFWALIKTRPKELGRKEPTDQICNQCKHRKCNGELTPFEINYRYMPAMMKEMRAMEKNHHKV